MTPYVKKKEMSLILEFLRCIIYCEESGGAKNLFLKGYGEIKCNDKIIFFFVFIYYSSTICQKKKKDYKHNSK
jgi:hypothetical protein